MKNNTEIKEKLALRKVRIGPYKEIKTKNGFLILFPVSGNKLTESSAPEQKEGK